jgi:hypothetical protein
MIPYRRWASAFERIKTRLRWGTSRPVTCMTAGRGACALQGFISHSANFPPPLARPAGRLGKQIARLACGPGGLSQWDSSGSELGRQVAVDFESDADFHECGSCPVHSRLPISSQRRSITRHRLVQPWSSLCGVMSWADATVGSRCAQSSSASRLTARCSDST